MKQFKSVATLVVLGMLLVVFTASATSHGLVPPQNPGGLIDISYHPASGERGIPGLIANIINIFLAIAGTIAVLFIIVGGFQYILSGANEDLAKKGKSTLVNAVIGLIIIVLSYTVVRVVFSTLTTV